MPRLNERDDFPAAIKLKLAARAGHECSNPECGARTSGPQQQEDGAVNVGVAAHITSASPGGPRYNPSLTPAARRGIGNGIWLCQNCAKLVDNDERRYTEALLRQWRAAAEQEARRQVGKSQRSAARVTSIERELKRNQKLRDELKEALTRPWTEVQQLRARRGDGRERPFDKFQYSKLVIHRLGENNYPDIVNENGISTWFTLEPFDFYHNGIKFILDIKTGIIENCQGYPGNMHWAIIPFDADFDRAVFRRINIWKVGRIPYSNIRNYDPNGDEYFNTPHLHCDFSINGMPYEGFEYAIVAKGSDNYDYPLKPELQLPTETVVIPINERTQTTGG